MKKIRIVSITMLVIILLSFLRYCSFDGAIYSKYNSIKIDDEQIYTKNYPLRMCSVVSFISPFVVVDEKEYAINTFFSSCSSQFYLWDNTKYITLNEAIKDGIISGESVLNYDWPFEYYEVYDLINNIEIDYITLETRIVAN